MWASHFPLGIWASLQRMRHMVRGLVLLLLMALGQAETAMALDCAPPVQSRVMEALPHRGDHTHCASHSDGQRPGSDQTRMPDDEAPGRSGSHDGPSCVAMLGCGPAVALPSLATAVLPASQATGHFSVLILEPLSRAEAPGNPPPRA